MWLNFKKYTLIIIFTNSYCKCLLLQQTTKLELMGYEEIPFDSSIYHELNIFNFKTIADNIKALLKKYKVKNCDAFIVIENNHLVENISLQNPSAEQTHYYSNAQKMKINSVMAYYCWLIAHPYILQKIILSLAVPINIKIITTACYSQIAAYKFNNPDFDFKLPELTMTALNEYLIENANLIIKDLIRPTELIDNKDVLIAIGMHYLRNSL